MLAGMEPNIQVAGTVCVNIWTRLGLDALRSGGDTPEGGGEWTLILWVLKGCSDPVDVAVPNDNVSGSVYT